VQQITFRGVDIVKRFGRGRRILQKITKGNAMDLLETADLYVDAMRRELLLPGTGRIYTRTGLPSPHQASAPGAPPASWTSTLFWAIDSIILAYAPPKVGVGIDANTAPYWKPLEFGTARMLPRPFVRRALALANRRAIGQFRRRLRERAQKIIAEGA
jgi:hypothetical protein